MNWQRRTEFIGGVPFTTIEPLPPASGGPVNFDGGVRGDYNRPPPRPHEYRDEDGWVTVDIPDGASLFFGRLGGDDRLPERRRLSATRRARCGSPSTTSMTTRPRRSTGAWWRTK